jgi:heme/copper-type cytochrome/quinol oxidase subunit 2
VTTNEIVSAAIFVVFVVLLVWGATSTGLRSMRYARRHRPQPVLLKRDRDLLLGLAVPFVLIAAVRAFGLQWLVNDSSTGSSHIWWQLITGLPPIYALARYCWFEQRIIERPPKT